MPHTLRDALTAAVPLLQAAGVETPQLDAQLLLAHVLGRDRTYLYAHLHDALPDELQQAFETLVRRRTAREPLPYLLGRWEWMGMSFRVTPAVLIPRPETEVLVEAVAERLPQDARVLDVGAGSGCISIGLARLLAEARITALERSVDAADVARENAEALGVGAQVSVVRGSFPEDAPAGPLDAVVSNPPYIPSDDVDRLPPELRCHEPRGALDGGPDGLHLLRALASESPALLRDGGLLAVEVAQGQAERVTELLRAEGQWEEPESVRDLSGIARVVLARKGR
ncbi:MAG TPA: peptide chain release factor N(5)-glutamine methyltransferase [Armatimonadota bacterium]|nr:peptide chain release factor N(5)-glutamine methyltransferase [Armatimonadota bacterium]